MNSSATNRNKSIMRVSVIGILTNFLLVVGKSIVGFLAGSITIILDAVNNLTDSLSSTVTFIGTKLAGRKPDKEHPFGHGRWEYLTSMIVAIIILYAGITSVVESVKKIITPLNPDYSYYTFIIVIMAILAKIFLSIYFRISGKKYNSDALLGSGNDAIIDVFISISTLISALVLINFNVNIEAYLGIVISIFILKAGISIMRPSISKVLGVRIDSRRAKAVKDTVCSFEGVNGAYDLILNDYGPDIYMGSIHIEVDENMKASKIDELARKISEEVYLKHGVILNTVGVYALNTSDEDSVKVRKRVERIIEQYESVIGMHGFYYSEKDKTLSFDIILDFEDPTRLATYECIYRDVKSAFEDYNISITMDIDASD